MKDIGSKGLNVGDAGNQRLFLTTLPCPDLEASVNEAIAACGYDLRATIGALIVANAYLSRIRFCAFSYSIADPCGTFCPGEHVFHWHPPV